MRPFAATVAGLAMLWLALPAAAQGRSSVQLSSPGRMNLGASSVTTFSQYSSGASELRRGVGGGTGPMARSYAINRAGDSAASPYASYSAPVGGPTKGMQLDGGPRLMMESSGPTGVEAIFSKAAPFGGDMGIPQESLLQVAGQAIVSLVPPGTGPYAECMRDGERAFREQQYVTAFNRFEMAHQLGDDPESLLSMAHAKFAGGSYTACAYYLRQTLRALPQLPRINLSPRDFYSDRTKYVGAMLRLDDYIARNPGNAEAALIKAYFAWFDPDRGPAKAQEAITEGLSKPNPPQATQALEMFQESMLAALQARQSAAATTKPANP